MCISLTSIMYTLNTIGSSVCVSWCHHNYFGKTCTHMHMAALFHVSSQENVLLHTAHYTSSLQDKNKSPYPPTTRIICRHLHGLSQTHPWSNWAAPAPTYFGTGNEQWRLLSW